MPNHITIDEAIAEIMRLDRLEIPVYVGAAERRAAAREIRLATMRAHRLAERACNGVQGPDGHMKWTDADEEWNQNQIERQIQRVADALSGLDPRWSSKYDLEHQADPRGAPFIVHTVGVQDRAATFW